MVTEIRIKSYRLFFLSLKNHGVGNNSPWLPLGTFAESIEPMPPKRGSAVAATVKGMSVFTHGFPMCLVPSYTPDSP